MAVRVPQATSLVCTGLPAQREPEGTWALGRGKGNCLLHCILWAFRAVQVGVPVASQHKEEEVKSEKNQRRKQLACGGGRLAPGEEKITGPEQTCGSGWRAPQHQVEARESCRTGHTQGMNRRQKATCLPQQVAGGKGGPGGECPCVAHWGKLQLPNIFAQKDEYQARCKQLLWGPSVYPAPVRVGGFPFVLTRKP